MPKRANFIILEQGTILLAFSVERSNEMNGIKFKVKMKYFLILYKMKPSKILDSASFKGCINSKLVTLKTFLNIFEIFE